MKKLLMTIVMGALLLALSIPTFAAQANPGCPNAECRNNGVCIGSCENSGVRPMNGTGNRLGRASGSQGAGNQGNGGICLREDCPNSGECTGTCENLGERPMDGSGRKNSGSGQGNGCGNSGSGVNSGKGRGRR